MSNNVSRIDSTPNFTPIEPPASDAVCKPTQTQPPATSPHTVEHGGEQPKGTSRFSETVQAKLEQLHPGELFEIEVGAKGGEAIVAGAHASFEVHRHEDGSFEVKVNDATSIGVGGHAHAGTEEVGKAEGEATAQFELRAGAKFHFANAAQVADFSDACANAGLRVSVTGLRSLAMWIAEHAGLLKPDVTTRLLNAVDHNLQVVTVGGGASAGLEGKIKALKSEMGIGGRVGAMGDYTLDLKRGVARYTGSLELGGEMGTLLGKLGRDEHTAALIGGSAGGKIAPRVVVEVPINASSMAELRKNPMEAFKDVTNAKVFVELETQGELEGHAGIGSKSTYKSLTRFDSHLNKVDSHVKITELSPNSAALDVGLGPVSFTAKALVAQQFEGKTLEEARAEADRHRGLATDLAHQTAAARMHP